MDDKALFVIKDCIEWRNEAITQGIAEIKQTLQELQVIKEIIQGDLKWFGKHCARKEDDFVAQTEEIIKETQKKF